MNSNSVKDGKHSKENAHKNKACLNSNFFAKNKGKPISYIKGDTILIAEITDESFSVKNGNYTYYEVSKSIESGVQIKKSASDIQVVPQTIQKKSKC